MEYTALDDNREELFTINRVDNKGYNVDLIVTAQLFIENINMKDTTGRSPNYPKRRNS